jgi:hypothetical protein
MFNWEVGPSYAESPLLAELPTCLCRIDLVSHLLGRCSKLAWRAGPLSVSHAHCTSVATPSARASPSSRYSRLQATMMPHMLDSACGDLFVTSSGSRTTAARPPGRFTIEGQVPKIFRKSTEAEVASLQTDRSFQAPASWVPGSHHPPKLSESRDR